MYLAIKNILKHVICFRYIAIIHPLKPRMRALTVLAVFAIVFPFMTLLCIPARLFLAPKFFEGWELCLLDGCDEEIEEWIVAKEAALADDGVEEVVMIPPTEDISSSSEVEDA